jgi:SAM-dependent methyltransferase
MESWEAFLRKRAPIHKMLEISPGWNAHWKTMPVTSYHSVDFPDFDIGQETLPELFDVVIADQVLEHVRDVDAAVRNIREMVAPGGHALIATPFLFRVHGRPNDFRRWTEVGLRQLLVANGFAEDALETFSWGNKACARAHIGGPVRAYGFGKDLSNDPEYPLMVWAIAGKPASAAEHLAQNSTVRN